MAHTDLTDDLRFVLAFGDSTRSDRVGAVLFKLVVTAAFLAWTIHQVPWLKRLGWYMLAAGLRSGGLVLFCWGFDLSFTLLGYTATTLLSLPEPQFRIIILGGAMLAPL